MFIVGIDIPHLHSTIKYPFHHYATMYWPAQERTQHMTNTQNLHTKTGNGVLKCLLKK